MQCLSGKKGRWDVGTCKSKKRIRALDPERQRKLETAFADGPEFHGKHRVDLACEYLRCHKVLRVTVAIREAVKRFWTRYYEEKPRLCQALRQKYANKPPERIDLAANKEADSARRLVLRLIAAEAWKSRFWREYRKAEPDDITAAANHEQDAMRKAVLQEIADERREQKERAEWVAKWQVFETELAEERRARETPAYLAFHGSDATVTRRLHRQLEQAGQPGVIAAALMRAQKASTRAKLYRGDYVDWSYGRKAVGMTALVGLLASDPCGMTWGWGYDPAESWFPWVLYVELPEGQVSFHAHGRGDGPDYPGDWDGEHKSVSRIIAFADRILAGQAEAVAA